MKIINDLKFEKTNQKLLRLVNVFISVLLMIALSGFYTLQLPVYPTKARISEALHKFPTAREKIMSDYSYSGVWPNKGALQEVDENGFDYVKQIIFDGKGTINFIFGDKFPELSGKTLSFVASLPLTDNTEKVIWHCGFSEVLQGYKIVGINQTDIEKKYLPSACR